MFEHFVLATGIVEKYSQAVIADSTVEPEQKRNEPKGQGVYRQPEPFLADLEDEDDEQIAEMMWAEFKTTMGRI